jgi:hypothetical protein
MLAKKTTLLGLLLLSISFYALVFIPGIARAALPSSSGSSGNKNDAGLTQGTKYPVSKIQRIDTALIKNEASGEISKEAYDIGSFENLVAFPWFLAFGMPEKSTGQASAPVIRQGGAVQSMSKFLAFIYDNPPATTETYVADILDNVGISTPAYAQGIGFASLSPVLEIWKSFRNLAYLAFVVIFLAIGFMIMLGKKAGQASITAQQALPRIIISLLAVTFSYAIAGFLIDLMYLFMYLVVTIFGSDKQLVSKNIFQVGVDIIKSGIVGDSYSAISDFIGNATSGMWGGLGDVFSLLGGLTFAAVVALAIIFAIFKLFFELLRTYVTIILSIVLSPLLLMTGAIPGNNAFYKWLRSLIGNLAAYPIVLVVLVLYYRIIEVGRSGMDGGFLPPYLIGSGKSGSISVLMGIGMLLILTDLVKQGKKMMGASEGVFGQFGQAVSDSLKKGWTGGELVPGVGLTDTRKLPFGGLSGKNVVTKGAIGGATVPGLALGLAGNQINRRILKNTNRGALEGAGWGAAHYATSLGQRLGDKQINKKTSENISNYAKSLRKKI